jgi:hypothetical protein
VTTFRDVIRCRQPARRYRPFQMFMSTSLKAIVQMPTSTVYLAKRLHIKVRSITCDIMSQAVGKTLLTFGAMPFTGFQPWNVVDRQVADSRCCRVYHLWWSWWFVGALWRWRGYCCSWIVERGEGSPRS